MFSCFKSKWRKKITTRGLFISAMSHVLTDHGDTCLYMPQKHEIYSFFYSFSKVFEENFIKNILQEMKNGLTLRQQQLYNHLSIS